jgi:RNA polymerase sigma-70 factor (ECF subfamily)
MPTTSRESDLAGHVRALRAYAVGQVRDRALADDLVQDTLLAAIAPGNASFDRRSSERTWLIGILKHKIADTYRARARQEVSLDHLDQGTSGSSDESSDDDVADEKGSGISADPQTTLARTQFVAACQRQLDRLSSRSSQAFVLSEVLGHEAAEVAVMLGMSAGHVWTSVHRTRRLLREALAPQFGYA